MVNEIVSFTKDTANTIGKTQRSVQQSIQISNKIAPETKEQIRNTDLADNKTIVNLDYLQFKPYNY